MSILIPFADKETLSLAMAERFVSLARFSIMQHGRFLAALSGGGTPQRLYELLATPQFADRIPWDKVHLLWGDERLVPPNDDGSNFKQVQETILANVPIPAANVHRMKGELDGETAVSDYTIELASLSQSKPWPRLDLALMGMGSDGHTASLFPGPIPAAETRDPVMLVTADYEDRPAHRLTLTPLVFNDARHVIFMVTGNKKAAVLAAILNNPEANYPATRIQPHDGTLEWYTDADAASLVGA